MKTLLTLCLLMTVSLVHAQLDFSNEPFDTALQRARTKGKLIFLQFESADCRQCNEVADKGFENKDLSAKLEQLFICLKVDPNHPDRNRLALAYNLKPEKSFGTLFLDDNGTLLHSYLRTSSFYKSYLDQIDIALGKTGEMLKISELEKEYNKGNRGYGFLALLLQKRKALYLPTDSLLDEYIAVLPSDSLKSISTLSFIAQMAPLLDSKADKALRADPPLFNRAWFSMSLPLRVSINNTIIAKGMEKAITEKDEKRAMRTALFAQGTNTNQVAGIKAYDMNMLHYYEQANDTTNYFRKSIAYYERYFLSVTPDSIRKADSLNLKRQLQTVRKDTVSVNDHTVKVSATLPYNAIGQRFSAELNSGAYNFFRRTNNPYLLSIATEWARKALEFYETPEALDTYAKLLYKQNQKKAAIDTMSRALALLKKRGFPTVRYEAAREKMNKNEKLTE